MQTRTKFVLVVLVSALFLAVASVIFAQGLDLNGYCNAKVWGRATLVEQNAYGWRCDDGAGNVRDMNIDEACRMQYVNASHSAYGNWDDPYSWYCVLNEPQQPPTVVPQQPSQPQVPPTAVPPNPGEQQIDPGCNINSFTLNPRPNYALGQHVQLAGTSSCGTVKFTLRNTATGDIWDRAEIGSTNQQETWKTEEFGAGTFEVCFVARGQGGWVSARRACETVQVASGNVPPTAVPPGGGGGGSTQCSTGRNLHVGDIAVVIEAGARLRRSAGTNYEILVQMPNRAMITMIGGPQCASGYVWWETQYAGHTGWVAEVNLIRNGDPIPSTNPGQPPTTVPPTPKPSNPDPKPPTVMPPVTSHIVELDFYFSPFGETYRIRVDKSNRSSCVVLNSLDIVAQEINRSRAWIDNKYDTEWWVNAQASLALYVGIDVDTLRLLMENSILRQTGCLDFYHQLPNGRTMDSNGLGNVVYGYYSVVVPKWASHRIADIDQILEDGRPDFVDDASQIDWGRAIGNYGDYVTASGIAGVIPSSFVSSK
jgi:hypothetical protein